MFLYDISAFMLYFFSMKFSIMTAPRYYDVTPYLTDPNENCTAYIKLEINDILFVRIFVFSEYVLWKLRSIKKFTSIVQLPYTSPPTPLAPH